MIQTSIRTTTYFPIQDEKAFKQKAFRWANQFELCCYFDSNHYTNDRYSQYESLIAVGKVSELLDPPQPFKTLRAFHQHQNDWLFGFLSYDLKNHVEDLSSSNQDELYFPQMHFFQPEVVVEIQNGHAFIHSINQAPQLIFDTINKTVIESKARNLNELPAIKARISRPEYLAIIEKIKQHILEGDIYEMNFCQEFFVENADINPCELFLAFNELTIAPHAAFYKKNNQFLLCASPERYMKKQGDVLISQPIKGTTYRGTSTQEDIELRKNLFHSEKDRSENVMIVDLVRNDLARVCQAGTVEVEELFGIYPFEQVHQMISTIKGQLRADQDFADALKNSFPMGSMTGAPKVMAMKLIEHYEFSKRGLYSGAVGYITPKGDFDFNVVIRSMLYNQARQYLSFQVGGAIVYDSIPEQEYEECLLKAKGILNVLASEFVANEEDLPILNS